MAIEMLNFSVFLFYIDVSLSPISFYLALKIDPNGSNDFDTLTLQLVRKQSSTCTVYKGAG